jgi:hypothetical protein
MGDVVDSDDDASVKIVRKAKSRMSYKRQKENGSIDGESDAMEELSSNTDVNKVCLFPSCLENNRKTRPSLKIRRKTFAFAVGLVLVCIPPRKPV